MKKIIFLFSFLAFSSVLYSQNGKTSQKALIKAEGAIVYNENFERGAELFQLNKPEEAIPFFEKALDDENVNPDIYIFLGVAYYQTGDFTKSLAVCAKGLAKDNTNRKVLAFNAGNSAYSMGNYMRADSCYALSMKEDADFAPAVLNRANAQLKLDHLEDSKNNYELYLSLEPESDQKERIELLISMLEQEIELRARQKPELINPDDFVQSEKMELPDIPEKVEDGYLGFDYALQKQNEDDEIVPEVVSFEDSVAPEIPAAMTDEVNAASDGESQPELDYVFSEDKVVEDTDAPELPSSGEKTEITAKTETEDTSVYEAEWEKSEKIDPNVVEVPVYDDAGEEDVLKKRRAALEEKVEVDIKDSVDSAFEGEFIDPESENDVRSENEVIEK